jgi:hypothetical protein
MQLAGLGVEGVGTLTSGRISKSGLSCRWVELVSAWPVLQIESACPGKALTEPFVLSRPTKLPSYDGGLLFPIAKTTRPLKVD